MNSDDLLHDLSFFSTFISPAFAVFLPLKVLLNVKGEPTCASEVTASIGWPAIFRKKVRQVHSPLTRSLFRDLVFLNVSSTRL